jgi:transcriptional regulator with XRE-family HTH domain
MGRSGALGFESARLREARVRAELTQAGLAERMLAGRAGSIMSAGRAATPAGIRRAARELENLRLQVLDYEQGARRPRAPILVELATACGVDPLELLDPATPVTVALARVRAGLLQDDVAATLGWTREYYSRVERGLVAAEPRELPDLARALGITGDELNHAIDGRAGTVADLLGARRGGRPRRRPAARPTART